jgi:hypothetical protein
MFSSRIGRRLASFVIIGICTLALHSSVTHAGRCEAGFKWCPDHLGGGCAPIGSTCCPGATHTTDGGRCAREEPGSYGAIAAALWRRSDGGVSVTSGVSWNYSSLAQASERAVNECKKRGGQGCRVIGTFKNGGCGYISTGSDREGSRYGTGATPAEAYSTCASKGGGCTPAVGGCTSSD